MPKLSPSENSQVTLQSIPGKLVCSRPLFDLQIRDYSLMDFLAESDYDVWAIDLHGYGRSDKTDKDWTDSHSAAADIAAAVGVRRAQNPCRCQ
jgi:hypothetical protein